MRKGIFGLIVAALILSVAPARAQQPTFAQLGGGSANQPGCSGALVFGQANWCFDSDLNTTGNIYWNVGGVWTVLSPTFGELTINTGITASSAGYNAFTIASPVCTTSGAGGTCAEPTHTFSPVGFADANYFINCTCNGTLTGVPAVAGVTTKSSNAVVVTIFGATSVSASCANVDCIAVHK